jgi:beta-fructofuranosidase
MYGLLNDPNGFVWYNGRYYLFYQWFPFGAVHGMKHWF